LLSYAEHGDSTKAKIPTLAEDRPVISVKEARKLMGKDAALLSDSEVEKLISDFSAIARSYLRSLPKF
jgi:hypothetical protein